MSKYASALIKGASGVTHGERGARKFMRVEIDKFEENVTAFMLVDVRATSAPFLREELRNALLRIRDDIDTMLEALAKVKE
jgi:hypothetical protein